MFRGKHGLSNVLNKAFPDKSVLKKCAAKCTHDDEEEEEEPLAMRSPATPPRAAGGPQRSRAMAPCGCFVPLSTPPPELISKLTSHPGSGPGGLVAETVWCWTPPQGPEEELVAYWHATHEPCARDQTTAGWHSGVWSPALSAGPLEAAPLRSSRSSEDSESERSSDACGNRC